MTKRYQSRRYTRIPGSSGISRTGDGLDIQVTAFKAIDYNQRTDRSGSEIHTACENQSSYDILMIIGKKKFHGWQQQGPMIAAIFLAAWRGVWPWNTRGENCICVWVGEREGERGWGNNIRERETKVTWENWNQRKEGMIILTVVIIFW